MNELVSLLNSVIPIISNVVGIIVLWYIFSKNDLAAYCTTKMGQMEDNKEQQN
jgi:hypothetical protein